MAHNRPSRGGPESEGTGEIRFHYSRGERLQHHSAQATGDSEQRRRRLNKRLLIIVLDILLVSVVYLIFVFFCSPIMRPLTCWGSGSAHRQATSMITCWYG